VASKVHRSGANEARGPGPAAAGIAIEGRLLSGNAPYGEKTNER